MKAKNFAKFVNAKNKFIEQHIMNYKFLGLEAFFLT